MKHLSAVKMLVIPFTLLVACNTGKTNKESLSSDIRMEKIDELHSPAEDSTAVVVDSAVSALNEDPITQHPFIRTARLNFKVAEVTESVYIIENKTRQLGGYVSNSTIENTPGDSSRVPISEDSSLQTRQYTVQGKLILRVPDNRLDSLLAALKPIPTFLSYREINSEDVSFQLLSNQLTQRRTINSKSRIVKAIDQKGKKLSDIVDAENNVENKEAAADMAGISNLTLQDSVNYSTVSVFIYQDPKVQVTIYANEKHIDAFGSSFIHQLGNSVSEGWLMLGDTLVFLLKFWVLYCLAIPAYFLYRRFFMPAGKAKIS